MPVYWDAYYFELAVKHQATRPDAIRSGDSADYSARLLRACTWIGGACGVIAVLAAHALRLG